MDQPAFEYLSDASLGADAQAVDAFGHSDYATTVVTELDRFPRQFTLGLFGDWGSGKSTILGEIGLRLKEKTEPKTVFVLFDAWRFEGDSLRREFIRSVGESLQKQDALQEGFDFERHIEALESETTETSRGAKRLQGAC